MTICLSLRKRVRKLIANSKGFSSVIGTTFMVLVMLFLSTSVFLWTLSQNTMYNEAVRARSQEDADRYNENVVALGGNYSVSGDNVTVNVILKNAGSVAVQIINLWVLDTDLQRYANKSLNLNLNPGNVSNLIESDLLTVIILGANENHNFVSWFVTARGNTIPLEKEQAIIIAQLAQGIGSIALDFYTFRYFEYEGDSSNKLKNYSDGNVSFNIPHGTDIALGIVLTNLDPSKQTITLYSHSLVWLYFPAVPGHTLGPRWYIVNEINGTIQSSYSSEISIQYGASKLIIFASAKDGSFDPSKDKVNISDQQQKNALGAVNLLLYGKIGSRDYGQNIPFVSLYCS